MMKSRLRTLLDEGKPDACRYPPRGTRGWGPHRAAGYGLFEQEYTAGTDDMVMYVPIIESFEAVEQIEDIMAVEGVDGDEPVLKDGFRRAVNGLEFLRR